MGYEESGDLVAHNKAMLARARDLRPIEGQIRHILTAGKREHLLAGKDSLGRPFAPLKQSTLKRRKGNGPALSPRGPASRLPSGYQVEFERRPYSVGVLGGWEGLPWLKHHKTGTRHMAKRDPGNFREVDRQAVGELLRDYVMNGKA